MASIPTQWPTDESDWIKAFDSLLRKKSYEQYKLLLLDFKTSSEEQKVMVGKILFEDHLHVQYWVDYINYAMKNFSDRKLHILRLVNKAIEILDENTCKHLKEFLELHLLSAKFKNTSEEMLRYFQNTIWKRDIGKNYADLYLAWAEVEKSASGTDAALHILQKGLDNNAEPRILLEQKINELTHGSSKEQEPIKMSVMTVSTTTTSQVPTVITSTSSKSESNEPKRSTRSKKETESKTLALFDDGEVQFNKKIKTSFTPSASTSNTTFQSDSIDEDDEPTKTQKLPIKPESSKKETNTKLSSASSLKRLKAAPTGLLGKCQRVATPIPTADSDDQLLDEIKEETPVVPSVIAPTSSSVKKVDLSKYMDDSLRNFDPNSRLKAKEVNENNTPTITTTNKVQDTTKAQKKLPFSILDTKVELPSTNTAGSASTSFTNGIEEVGSIKPSTNEPGDSKENAAVAIQKPTTTTKKRKFGSTISTEDVLKSPEIVMKKSKQSGKVTEETSAPQSPTEMTIDADTMKIPTEDVKDILAAIPVEPVKLVPGSGGKSASKRKRVSFTSQFEEESKAASKALQSSTTSQPPQITLPDASAGMFADPSRYLTLNNKSFISLNLLGKGGSSAVHKVISCTDGTVYALKRVEVKDNEDFEQVFESYANEINLLKSLKGSSPYIIDLVDYDVSKDNKLISMLLEVGDIDLAKLLSQKIKLHQSSSNSHNTISSALDPIFARMIWKEMLLAVHHIHENRIVHGDLKPANFVFVKGHLKLIDFGIAKSFSSDTTNIYRDSQIGTVNYMAPEAIAPTPESICRDTETNSYSMKLGRASDIWSLGCILYQIIFTRPPFAALNTIQKLSAIPNPKFEIPYPEHHDADAIESIKACLVRNPKERAPIMGENGLMRMAYLQIPLNLSSDSNIQNKTITQSAEMSTSKIPTSSIPSIDTSLGMVTDVLRIIKAHLPSKSTNVLDFIDAKAILRELQVNHDQQTNHHTASSSRTESTASQSHTIDKENHEQSKPSLRSTSKPVPTTSAKKPTTSQSVSKALFTKMKSPLKSIPINLREEIVTDRSKLVSLQSEEAVARANKWMKQSSSDNNELKSVLERRFNVMRQFLDEDQDNVTATESIDMSLLM